MITLGKDRYEHSYADGTDNGIKVGVDMTASGVITFMKEIGVTADEAISKFSIPDEYRADVEKEVRRKLSQ